MSMIVNPFRFAVIGGGGGPTARYWRLRISETQVQDPRTNPYTTIDDIEMRATISGADQIVSSSGGIASSFFSGSFLTEYAFDGANGNVWAPDANTANYGTHWVGYDFGSGGTSTAVNEIAIAKRPTTAGAQEAPIIGALQYSSDATTWTTAWSFVTLPTWGTGAETRVFSSVTGKRFWRIRCLEVQGGSGNPFATSKVRFRGTSGGSDLATGGIPIGSLWLSGYPPADAYDGTDGTFYHSNDNLSVLLPWVGYAWLTAQDINEVTIQMRSDGFGGRANQAITSGVVQSSEDYETWTDEWSFTSPATWSGTETRTFTRP
jgi:hypothetical protein